MQSEHKVINELSLAGQALMEKSSWAIDFVEIVPSIDFMNCACLLLHIIHTSNKL